MAVKIKLKRLGKIRAPFYRIVVADARTKREGRAIEEIGKYDPKENPSFIEVNSDRVQYWLGVGAQPTDSVLALLKVTGDWQEFKGEPPPPPMKVAEPKADKLAVFEAAAKEAAAEPKEAATTARGRSKKTQRKSADTEKPADTEKSAETEKPADTQQAAETEKPAETEKAEAAAQAESAQGEA